MAIESLPTFTKPAPQRCNVWCGDCRHETTITNFSGTIKGGNLLLGKCAECHGDVARVILGRLMETGDSRQAAVVGGCLFGTRRILAASSDAYRQTLLGLSSV